MQNASRLYSSAPFPPLLPDNRYSCLLLCFKYPNIVGVVALQIPGVESDHHTGGADSRVRLESSFNVFQNMSDQQLSSLEGISGGHGQSVHVESGDSDDSFASATTNGDNRQAVAASSQVSQVLISPSDTAIHRFGTSVNPVAININANNIADNFIATSLNTLEPQTYGLSTPSAPTGDPYSAAIDRFQT